MNAPKYLFAAGAILLLFACSSEEYLYEGSVPEVKQAIYNPEKGFIREIEVDLDETLYLYYSLFRYDRQVSPDSISYLVARFFWVFEDKTYNSSTLPLTFSEAGVYKLSLNTVDYFGDTLQEKLTIYANTPLSIQANTSPKSANPLDSSGVDLEWEISGLDSWEKPQCILYVSANQEKLWNTARDTISCESPFHLKGPFSSLIPEAFRDTSYVFYWGIKIEITNTKDANRDSSSFYFRTRLIENPEAILEIPVRYSSISPENTPQFRLSLLSAGGDTLQALVSGEKRVRFRNVSPAANLTVSAEELLYPEYRAKEITENALSGIYSVTDTLFFEDLTLPERKPLQTTLAEGDSIGFVARDLGSGLNKDFTEVFMNGAVIPFRWSGDTLYFKNACFSDSCEISVRLLDYSGNESSPVYWEISRQDTLFVIGHPKITEARP
ncbi:MAG: hypothetical protein LBR60_03490 [Fibrobacter sp.]|nr:hypothetical protein [Fibrobacter sp.]